MTLKRLGATVIAAAALLAAVSVSSASAGNAYLCYSNFQIDPGVWSDSPSSLKGGSGGNVSAGALLKLGYWAPFATKTATTNTKLPGGWYLHCNPPGVTVAGFTATTIIGGAGETVGNSSLASLPGYYPQAP
jgi:hypothetical protein